MAACTRLGQDGRKRLGRDAHGLTVGLGTQRRCGPADLRIWHVQTDLGQDLHGSLMDLFDLAVAEHAKFCLDVTHGATPPFCCVVISMAEKAGRCKKADYHNFV